MLDQTLARIMSDEPLLREAIGDLEAADELLRVEGLRVPFPAFFA